MFITNLYLLTLADSSCPVVSDFMIYIDFGFQKCFFKAPFRVLTVRKTIYFILFRDNKLRNEIKADELRGAIMGEL